MFDFLIDPLAAWILATAKWLVAHPEHAHRAAEWLAGIAALVAAHAGLTVRLTQWLEAHRAALLRVAEAIQGQGERAQGVKDSLRRDPLPGGPQAALSSIVAIVRPDETPAAWWKRLLIVLIPWARLLLKAAVKKS